MNLLELIEGKNNGGLIYGDNKIEKNELIERYRRFGKGLRELMDYFEVQGVGIYGRPSIEIVTSILGTISSGNPAVMIPFSVIERNLDPYYIEKGNCNVVITDKPEEVAGKTRSKIIVSTSERRKQEFDGRHVIPFEYLFSNSDTKYKIDSNSPAFLLYTSGTSSEPKLVILTHKNISSNIKQAEPLMEYFKIKEGEKVYNSLPLFHSYGLTIGLLLPLSLGLYAIISKDIKNASKEIKETKPDVVPQVPLFYYKMRDSIEKGIKQRFRKYVPNDLILHFLTKFALKLPKIKKMIREELGNPKLFISGGAPVNHKAKEFFENLGIRFVNGYGLTEASPLVAVGKDSSVWLEVLGGIDVVIKEGVIHLKGPNISPGYYNGERIEWLNTGDIGKQKGNKIRITGRKKNVIVLPNGENVSPEKIEEKLLLEGLVAKVCEEDGTIKAYVDPTLSDKDSLKRTEEIKRRVNKKLFPYERIRRIEISPLVLTPTLKVKR